MRIFGISLVVVFRVDVSVKWWLGKLLVIVKSGWSESVELLNDEGNGILKFFLII